MKRSGPCILLLFLAAAGCSNNPEIPGETQVVVEGFLYAARPVRDIRLSVSSAIGGSDSANPPLAGASVVLSKNGIPHPLSPDTARPGYYYSTDTSLSVNSGDDFRLVANASGETISAETVVPGKPQAIAVSRDTLRFQTQTIQTPNGGTRTAVTGLDTAVVTWLNPAGNFFYIVIESIDSARQPLRPEATFRNRFISQPTNEASYTISNNSVTYTGRHVLRVYSVNREYADLYRSREQDSRALNEPATNIHNGLGVFTAFSSDSLFFTVRLDSSASAQAGRHSAGLPSY
jgi:hypothetical protein